MFKIFKRKLVQNVHRVEDLQEGDILQHSLCVQAKVQRILQLNDNQFHIEMQNLANEGPSDGRLTATLHRDLKVFVWR